MPLPVGTQPDAVEVAPVAKQAEAQREAAVAGVREELTGQCERHHVVQLRTRRDLRKVDAFLRRCKNLLVVLAPLLDAPVALLRHVLVETHRARLEPLFALASVGELLVGCPFAVVPPDLLRVGDSRELLRDGRVIIVHLQLAELDDGRLDFRLLHWLRGREVLNRSGAEKNFADVPHQSLMVGELCPLVCTPACLAAGDDCLVNEAVIFSKFRRAAHGNTPFSLLPPKWRYGSVS